MGYVNREKFIVFILLIAPYSTIVDSAIMKVGRITITKIGLIKCIQELVLKD